MISRRALLHTSAATAALVSPIAAEAFTQAFTISVTGTNAVFTGLTLSNSAFAAGSAGGTVVGQINVTLSLGTFNGTIAVSGTNGSDFTVVNNSGIYDLETVGTLSAGSYSIVLTPTENGIGAGSFTPPTVTIAATSPGNMTATLSFAAINNLQAGSWTGNTIQFSSAGDGNVHQTVISASSMGAISDITGPLMGLGTRFSCSAVRVWNALLPGYSVTFIWYSDTGHGTNNRACAFFHWGYSAPTDTFSNTSPPSLGLHTVSIAGDFNTSSPLTIYAGYHGLEMMWRWTSWDPTYSGTLPSTITLPTYTQMQAANLLPQIPAPSSWAAGYTVPSGGHTTPQRPFLYPYNRYMETTGEYPGLDVISGFSMYWLTVGTSWTGSILTAAEAGGYMPWCAQDKRSGVGKPLDFTDASITSIPTITQSGSPPAPMYSYPNSVIKCNLSGGTPNGTFSGGNTSDNNGFQWVNVTSGTFDASGNYAGAQFISQFGACYDPIQIGTTAGTGPTSMNAMGVGGGVNVTCTPIPSTFFAGTGMQYDLSHLPEYQWLPLLLTGDPYYLLCLQYQAQFTMNILNPSGDIYIGAGQPRAQAWGMRCMVQCAAATPSSVPNWLLPKSVFTGVLGRLMQGYIDNEGTNTGHAINTNIIRTINFGGTGYGGTTFPSCIGGELVMCDANFGMFQAAYFFGSTALGMIFDKSGYLGSVSPGLTSLVWYWNWFENFIQPNAAGDGGVAGFGSQFCADYQQLGEVQPMAGDAGQQASADYGEPGGLDSNTSTCNGVEIQFNSYTDMANYYQAMINWNNAHYPGRFRTCPNTIFQDMGAYGAEYYAGAALTEQARALGYAVPNLSVGKGYLLASFAANSQPVDLQYGYA